MSFADEQAAILNAVGRVRPLPVVDMGEKSTLSMAEYIYYSTFFVTMGLVALVFTKSLSAIQKGKDRFRCIVYFGISSILSGLISGAALFYGVLSLFDFLGHHVSVGHGEILIAAPVFNFGLGVVLAVMGTTLLRWLTPEG